MATIVFFHAHPDDECISTGGTMAMLADAGHRVVLVTATRGEHGEVPDGLLAEGEQLAQRRVEEVHASAEVLGVARGEFLGYIDSGMIGTPENEAPESFWQADVEEAAERLAAILREEDAEVLTLYDEHGNYGHPDHIQVHRVGVRAAELAGTQRAYMATVNRDHMKALMSRRGELGLDVPEDAGGPPDGDFFDTMGEPAARITTTVDVTAWVARKRAAMACHATQISDSSFFLAMPEEVFAMAFGQEWYIRLGVDDTTHREHALV